MFGKCLMVRCLEGMRTADWPEMTRYIIQNIILIIIWKNALFWASRNESLMLPWTRLRCSIFRVCTTQKYTKKCGRFFPIFRSFHGISPNSPPKKDILVVNYLGFDSSDVEARRGSTRGWHTYNGNQVCAMTPSSWFCTVNKVRLTVRTVRMSKWRGLRNDGVGRPDGRENGRETRSPQLL